MIGSEDLAFYHCFPRRAARISAAADRPLPYSPEREIHVGLATLELILEFGLVLSSERLRLNPLDLSDEGAADSPRAEQCIVPQWRVCFTLGSLEDLARRRCVIREPASHLDLFGRFAVALTPDVGRTLGLLPVHYFYRSTREDDAVGALGGLSDLLTTKLLQVREVLTFLAYSERQRKTRRGGDRSLADFERNYEREGLTPQLAKALYRDRIMKRISNASCEELAFVQDLMKFDRFHIGDLADSISMLLATYQTVDSISFDSSFLYYFQQEWRLLSTFHSEAIIYDLSGSGYENEEVLRLIQDANDGLAKIALAAGHDEMSLGDAMLLHGYSQPIRPFHEAIGALVCPKAVEPDVRHLASYYGLGNVAVLPCD